MNLVEEFIATRRRNVNIPRNSLIRFGQVSVKARISIVFVEFHQDSIKKFVVANVIMQIRQDQYFDVVLVVVRMCYRVGFVTINLSGRRKSKVIVN